MANKVIQISSTSRTTSEDRNLEVFRDISMTSERRNTMFIENDMGNPRRVHRQSFRVTKDINVKAVFNSLRNIFTWIPGERILNP